MLRRLLPLALFALACDPGEVSPRSDIDPDDPFVYGCVFDTLAVDDYSPKACAIRLARCVDVAIGVCDEAPKDCQVQQENCWTQAVKCRSKGG